MINALRISLTDICNYGCLFCHNEGLVEGENETVLDPEAARLIAEAASRVGIKKYTISGGEPMVNKQFLGIIEQIRATAPEAQINMASNLSLVRPGQIERIVKLIDQINVNFQAATASGFKFMTRLDKFEAIAKRLDEICALGGREKISLNYVYTQANRRELTKVVRFSEEKNLKLKILEVIRDEQNQFLHIPARELVMDLRELGYEPHRLVGRSDEHFIKDSAPSRIRVIHSYCNTGDEDACRVHGEVRITPELELRPCIAREDNGISIAQYVRDEDIDGICASLTQAGKGEEKTCPLQKPLSESSALVVNS